MKTILRLSIFLAVLTQYSMAETTGTDDPTDTNTATSPENFVTETTGTVSSGPDDSNSATSAANTANTANTATGTDHTGTSDGGDTVTAHTAEESTGNTSDSSVTEVTPVTEVTSVTGDTGDDAVTITTDKCPANEIEIAGSCVTEFVVPGIAVGVFVLILLIGLAIVGFYRSSHPWEEEKAMSVQGTEMTGTISTGERAGVLWASTDDSKPVVANGNLSNGGLHRFDYDNGAFHDDDFGSTSGRGKNDTTVKDDQRYSPSQARIENEYNSLRRGNRRDEECDSVPEQQRPPVEDTYMNNLEMSDLYRGFNANLSGVSRAADYSIQRPQIYANGPNYDSVRGRDGVFTGDEVNI